METNSIILEQFSDRIGIQTKIFNDSESLHFEVWMKFKPQIKVQSSTVIWKTDGIPVGPDGFRWIPMDPNGSQWISIDPDVSWWILMDPNSTGSYWIIISKGS